MRKRAWCRDNEGVKFQKRRENEAPGLEERPNRRGKEGGRGCLWTQALRGEAAANQPAKPARLDAAPQQLRVWVSWTPLVVPPSPDRALTAALTPCGFWKRTLAKEIARGAAAMVGLGGQRQPIASRAGVALKPPHAVPAPARNAAIQRRPCKPAPQPRAWSSRRPTKTPCAALHRPLAASAEPVACPPPSRPAAGQTARAGHACPHETRRRKNFRSWPAPLRRSSAPQLQHASPRRNATPTSRDKPCYETTLSAVTAPRQRPRPGPEQRRPGLPAVAGSASVISLIGNCIYVRRLYGRRAG